MRIDQRNAGALVSSISSAYTLDRWLAFGSPTSKFTVQQNSGSVTPPVGFSNYLGAVSISAYSVASGDFYAIQQAVEGFNSADLAWGTANAATITISFWVRSSLTGTFGGALRNSATNRSYPFTYTITAANTWEKETITIAGDTTGTWVGATNGAGIYLSFGLGVGATFSGTAGAWAAGNFISATGATSVVGTNGATFYITGVQLEKGSTATSFDYRPYGTELSLAQRYYYRLISPDTLQAFSTGYSVATNLADGVIPFPVQMRTNPTALEQTGTAANYSVRTGSTDVTCSAVPSIITANSNNSWVRFTVASGLTLGQGVILRTPTANSYLGWSAEL
jgi:hypothetical protein